MGEPILVTGGTGVLGRVVVRRLLAADLQVRVMSRRTRPSGAEYSGGGARSEWAVADLRTGHGVDDAVAGTGAIVHCATPYVRGREPAVTGTLVEAAKRASTGTPHLVYVSIVGVDREPVGYYRGKLAAERLVEGSGLPHTIQRVTQFHDLIRLLLAGAATTPVMLVPDLRAQPVDVRDVAARLVEIALGDPVGRAPDFGGPQVREVRDLARAFLAATGRRRRVAGVRLPGAVFRAYRQGRHLVPEQPGGITFEDYLAGRVAPGAVSYRGRRR